MRRYYINKINNIHKKQEQAAQGNANDDDVNSDWYKELANNE